MDTIEQEKYTEDSLLQVRKFVTKVWEHPLLTEATRHHRQELKKMVDDLMKKNGISKEQYIGLPVGGSTWISRGIGDDFDVILFGENEEVVRKIEEITPNQTGDVDIITFGSAKHIHNINENWPYNIFYIPDEYIVGNLQIAQEVRKSLTGQLHPDNRERFDRYAPQLFNTFFRDWNKDLWYKNQNPISAGKRAERFNIALESRSLQSHSPDKWKSVFIHNVNTITSPDFTTFSRAMKISNGTLTLLNNQKAQGILITPVFNK
jgi:hypothetical protein